MIGTALAPRKRLLFGVVVLAAAGVALLVRFLRVWDFLPMSTGVAAQQTCACLFVSGRTLASCMTDLDPLVRRFISVRPGPDEVTASGFGMSSATSRYEDGFGCSLRN